MNAILTLFCGFMLIAGTVILVEPNYVINPIKKYRQSRSLYMVAIIARALIGLLLLAVAVDSNSPFAAEILGWLFITAALIFVLIGHKKFVSMLDWTCDIQPKIARLMGVAAMGFAIWLYTLI